MHIKDRFNHEVTKKCMRACWISHKEQIQGTYDPANARINISLWKVNPVTALCAPLRGSRRLVTVNLIYERSEWSEATCCPCPGPRSDRQSSVDCRVQDRDNMSRFAHRTAKFLSLQRMNAGPTGRRRCWAPSTHY